MTKPFRDVFWDGVEEDPNKLPHPSHVHEKQEFYEYPDPYSCEDCKHQKECQKEWGEEYEAVIGTHHCRRSWDDQEHGSGT